MTLADTTRAGVDEELREAMLTGRLVDLRTGDPAADDPAHGAAWDRQRTVTATLLVELLTTAQGSRRPRALRLAGARITGQLDLEAADLVCPLLLAGCWFAEPLVLEEARAAALRLPGCHLPGLSGDQLATRGNLELNQGFTARGEVRLVAAHIGGQLLLNGATLTNPNGAALKAGGLTVDQGMFCRQGFAARGEVNLIRAHIGGQLVLDGATLTNPDGPALYADGLTVDQGMFCREGFAATGEVNLFGAHIGDQLDLRGATLTNSDGLTLQLEQLRAGMLVLLDLPKPLQKVDFTYAHVGALVDEPASWPRQARLVGFVYDVLYERGPVSAPQRLGWLARDPDGYFPQPYEQLAAVYRRAGRDQDARTVTIAKQRARRHTLGRVGRLWSLLLDGLVGYGYRTWLAGLWLVGFWLVGWAVFDRAHAHGGLVAKPGETHPSYHGAIYSLDTLLPVVDLRQQAVWIPHGGAQWWASVSILAGWVLTTAVVAALTGLLKRD